MFIRIARVAALVAALIAVASCFTEAPQCAKDMAAQHTTGMCVGR